MDSGNPLAPGQGADADTDVDLRTMRFLIHKLQKRESETGAPNQLVQPSKWLEEEIGAPPLWLDSISYVENRLCLSCRLSVMLLAQDYKKRDQNDFKHEHLREVITLLHIDPAKLLDDYTAKDILNEAIHGCHLCSVAIGTSWFRGDLPFDTARWAINPMWRKRAQMLLFNMYRRNLRRDDPDSPLCQIIFGTSLTTDLYPEGDYSGFWGALHLYTEEALKRMYHHKSNGYILNSQIGDPPRPPLCTSTGDPKVLDIAAWWLRRCIAEHGACSAAGGHADDTESPARLLYVSGARNNHVKVYINDTKKNGVTPEYLTLSYCWGKKAFPRLTATNFAMFTDKIDIETLPATMRDAIQVTRRLGFSYIWIDALCIIQDSKADWAAESVKMGSIYRNSTLTIAALGASDSFQGCFMRRNPLCFRDIRVPDSNFFLSSRTRTVIPGFKWEFEVVGAAASPLQTRAWVVQEQLLSPRTLFFGSSGIFWQCIECGADESCPLGSINNSDNLKGLVNTSLASKDFNLRKIWRTILERYTSCKLTFPSDKLVAITGIARVLASASGQQYVAGLWVQDMWHDLLWHSQPSTWAGNHLLKRLEKGSPTFSWASVAQEIGYFKYDNASTVLDAKSVVIDWGRKGQTAEDA